MKLSTLLVIAGLAMATLAVSPLSLSTTYLGATHSFVGLTYVFGTNAVTAFSATIQTSSIQPEPSDASSSAWIAIYSAGPSNSDYEFLQAGWVDYRVNTLEQGPKAFWADFGSGVPNTVYVAQNISYVPTGSQHTYSLSFTGSAWAVSFDGKQIQTIQYAYPAGIIQIELENTCSSPCNSTNLGIGQFSVTNALATVSGSSIQFLSIPIITSTPSGSAIFSAYADMGEVNGVTFSCSSQSMQFGTGIATNQASTSNCLPLMSSNQTTQQTTQTVQQTQTTQTIQQATTQTIQTSQQTVQRITLQTIYQSSCQVPSLAYQCKSPTMSVILLIGGISIAGVGLVMRGKKGGR